MKFSPRDFSPAARYSRLPRLAAGEVTPRSCPECGGCTRRWDLPDESGRGYEPGVTCCRYSGGGCNWAALDASASPPAAERVRRAAVERLVDRLFTNGGGEVALRLAFVLPDKTLAGGMCRQYVVELVGDWLDGEKGGNYLGAT